MRRISAPRGSAWYGAPRQCAHRWRERAELIVQHQQTARLEHARKLSEDALLITNVDAGIEHPELREGCGGDGQRRRVGLAELHAIVRARAFAETPRDLDTGRQAIDPEHATAEAIREEARRAAEPAAHIEHASLGTQRG